MSIFADVLRPSENPGVRALAVRMRAPHAVAVRGRHGVGRDAVAQALTASGVLVADIGSADAQVVVLAEALKPEDRQMLSTDLPTVVVLNKADLAGREPGGPLASAALVAAGIGATVGRPVVPMIALLAAVELDDELVDALRLLAGTPADMTSADAFVESEHPLPTQVRRRMLTLLDRFGLAHAVLAVARGAAPAGVVRTLRELSQTDRVVERLTATGPEVRYRRMCGALDELHLLAAESGDDELAAFLATDDVVIAVMSAAVDVMETSGVRVDPADDADAHVRRAVRWRRYADGPLDRLHRRCAADISRGSLRLLGRAR